MSNEDLKPKSDQEMESDSMESQKPWEPMKLTYTGEAKDVVRGGTGKFSNTQSDPGDAKKPQGQG